MFPKQSCSRWSIRFDQLGASSARSERSSSEVLFGHSKLYCISILVTLGIAALSELSAHNRNIYCTNKSVASTVT